MIGTRLRKAKGRHDGFELQRKDEATDVSWTRGTMSRINELRSPLEEVPSRQSTPCCTDAAKIMSNETLNFVVAQCGNKSYCISDESRDLERI